MHNLKPIRLLLNLTQSEVAEDLDCSQANICHYENGQVLPQPKALRLISLAARMGVTLTYDHIYGEQALPKTKASA